MELKYYLFDPTKNMTILVETPVPAESQPFVASRLLQAEPTAEQVGFVSAGDGESDIALRMAGGEFCGNATMSTAALFCIKNGLTAASVRVRASWAFSPSETIAKRTKKALNFLRFLCYNKEELSGHE